MEAEVAQPEKLAEAAKEALPIAQLLAAGTAESAGRVSPTADAAAVTDWVCPACGARCWASRAVCFRCRTPRPAGDFEQAVKSDPSLSRHCLVLAMGAVPLPAMADQPDGFEYPAGPPDASELRGSLKRSADAAGGESKE